MTETSSLPTDAATLRAFTKECWRTLVELVDALSPAQWEGPVDSAGWTVKDHVAHVALWDGSLVGLIRDGIPRQQTLGVTDAAWQAGGYDAMNDEIRLRTLADSVEAIQQRRDAGWDQLWAVLAGYDDATIQRPGSEFGLSFGLNETLLETLIDDLGVHYDQHRQYIQAIVASDDSANAAPYRILVEERWRAYQLFLDGLTHAQWTGPTDANGWTVKDHVAHVTAWDTAFVGQALGLRSQRESLGVSQEIWGRGFDAINAVLRDQTLGDTPSEVRAASDLTIASSRQALDRLDLTQPARHVGLAHQDDDRSLRDIFVEDQANHYQEHQTYMRRILSGASS